MNRGFPDVSLLSLSYNPTIHSTKGDMIMDNGHFPKPITLATQGGRALWYLGALITFKALTTETNEQYWALEGLADKHMAVPLHAHSQEDEIWYVLEGEIAFILRDETRIGGPGAFVYIPRHVPHTFQVKSETARWFGIGLSGHLDQWFFETGEPAKALTLPPAPTAPQMKKLSARLLPAYKLMARKRWGRHQGCDWS
jgi:quercetin dioxygenase-like cupin family protein